MRISRSDWDELIAHARAESPNECCGYLWCSDGEIVGVARGRNERNSPYGYELDAESQFALWRLDEDEGFQVGSYHSHPRSPAEPSQTDINLAANWPDYLYLIVSLAGDPTVRAWWLRDGQVREEPLDVS